MIWLNSEWDEERYLKEILAQLQMEYKKAAKPYIDRLVFIYSLRPLPQIIVAQDIYNSMIKAREA